LSLLIGCSSSPLVRPGGSGGEGGADGSSAAGAAGKGDVEVGSFEIVNVFDQIPQFGLYVGSDPQHYTPPNGVVLWNHGTEYVSKLSELQQSQLGADLAVRVSYWAQCDEYDRLGGVFLLLEPKGRDPQPDDPRIELVRFVTPFSDFMQGALATHVYPDADVSAYASAIADRTQDVWIGIAGGSNPHDGDACTDTNGELRVGVTAEFADVGFNYSVDLVSTQPLAKAHGLVLTAITKTDETAMPVEATFSNGDAPVAGRVTVIVSGHGSAAGGSEYEYTQDTLTLNGAEIGAFSTQIDCAPYAKYSPRGNPGIFRRNKLGNPRNWCPGALVPARSFEATLLPGDNAVSLAVEPAAVPEGSYHATSIAFSAP